MSISSSIINEVKKAIIGKDDVIIRLYLAILAGGHVLIEDIPGVGKTTLAISFSKALELKLSRVQFTPDVLPSDIVGFSMYNKENGKMEYRPGAIHCNLFLADELNRATSRTQSALLESMEEGQVTVDGKSYPLPEIFTVIATQNPKGAAGTQLLPDSQLDRFMIKLSLGYPDKKSEMEMLARRQAGIVVETIQKIVNIDELAMMKAEVERVHIAPILNEYIVDLVQATRNNSRILKGASPRATLALSAMAKASAWVMGRDYIVPDDIKLIYKDCLAHRITLRPEAEESGTNPVSVMETIYSSIPVPLIR